MYALGPVPIVRETLLFQLLDMHCIACDTRNVSSRVNKSLDNSDVGT